MSKIFISYRREDSSGHAGRLYDHLANCFGETHIFMDIDNMRAGLDFVEQIEQAVQACDVLIAVIGKSWLTMKDEEGTRRLDNPHDFVRLEIQAALGSAFAIEPRKNQQSLWLFFCNLLQYRYILEIQSAVQDVTW